MLELLRGVRARLQPRAPSPYTGDRRASHACAAIRSRVSDVTPRPPRAAVRRRIADASHVRLLILANAYPGPDRPAYGSYVARGAEALAAQGHDVRVVALRPGRRGRLATPLAYARLGARATGTAVVWRPEAILSHFLVPTGSIARRAAALARVPYVLVAHGTDVANAERDPRLRAPRSPRSPTPRPSCACRRRSAIGSS